MSKQTSRVAVLALFGAVAAAGCAQMGSGSNAAAPAPAPASAAAPTPAPAPAPAPASAARAPASAPAARAAASAPAGRAAAAAPAPAAKAPAAGGGTNAKGEVTDSSKVAAGEGRKVKGQGGWEGEITGRPAPNSKFGRLEIGMPMAQVTDMIGQPTDHGVYVTGKAWIPFYFGSDTHRHELVYKGQGRLIFAGPAGFQYGSGNLIWIIHNASEPGYR